MDGSCGSVSLDAYWTNVAIPFLFIILGFGLFVLFSLSDIQFVGTEHIIRSVASLSRRGGKNSGRAEGNSGAPPPPPPPPAGANTARGKAPPAPAPAPAPAPTSTALVPYKAA